MAVHGTPTADPPGGPIYLATPRSHLPGEKPPKRSHLAAGRQTSEGALSPSDPLDLMAEAL